LSDASGRRAALCVMACWCASAAVLDAQGPLTGALPEAPLPIVTARLGPVELSPNFRVTQVGVDDNVFNDARAPKRDFVIAIAPDLTLFAQSGVIRFAVNTSSELTYYRKYESERAFSRALRGRFDLNIGRLRPSVAGATVVVHDRPNHEIDTRAMRHDTELSSRIAFEVSPLVEIYVGAARVGSSYGQGETFRGASLDESLNRRMQQAQVGFKFRATPFTTLIVDTTLGRDKFARAPHRDARTRAIASELVFSSEAIIRGHVRAGYQSFEPDDPALKPYRGLTALAALGFRGFWRGRLDGRLERQPQYSYDESEGYYISTGGDVTYTQHVVGPLDVQVGAGRFLLDYGRRNESLARRDVTRVYTGGIGYNRENGSRFGLNYELRERDARDERDAYARRRVYAAYSYTY
jgi:hypothetical protein